VQQTIIASLRRTGAGKDYGRFLSGEANDAAKEKYRDLFEQLAEDVLEDAAELVETKGAVHLLTSFTLSAHMLTFYKMSSQHVARAAAFERKMHRVPNKRPASSALASIVSSVLLPSNGGTEGRCL
jgi:hypothetical protein